MNYYSVFILLLLLVTTGACQNETDETVSERRKSPIAITKVNHQGTYVKIVYGQPYRRGRTIFGDLVPYGEVWRTGANEATELTTTEDILLAGNRLEAGTYSLFTIPNENQWTVILNSQLGQWGAFEYDAAFDALRFEVPSRTTEDAAEAFTIQFGEVTDDSTSIKMRWDQTEVHVPVEFLQTNNNP